MNKQIMTKQNIDDITLMPVDGSEYCMYSVLENKLEILYKNQEKILQAIKLLHKNINNHATGEKK